MSVQAEAQEQEEFDKLFTVFDGSSPEDVSHARQLWSSLSLLPPLESRLVSADIRQRLPVSRPQRSTTAGAKPSASEPPSVHDARQLQEERRRYAAMADQRKEIQALMRRQREQRIQKELLSVAFKPKVKVFRENMRKPQEASETEMDKELVKQLQ
ncbi:cilia- and flagella-associated protein HOATZ [Amphiprion ocellaris]|uniref:cilia- and flagella-associated protein HOATZ n=1 Tax=Amphiprion ocellaris TaxID=80972 RepID=UPI000C300191|nr:cilia- and flagella-associated protein HOATZ [Amphiprion ocellaris]